MLFHPTQLQIFMNTSSIQCINKSKEYLASPVNLGLSIWCGTDLTKRNQICSCLFRPKTVFILRFSWKKKLVPLFFYQQLFAIHLCESLWKFHCKHSHLNDSSSSSQCLSLSFTGHDPCDQASVSWAIWFCCLPFALNIGTVLQHCSWMCWAS